jgi:hypothetical protein
MKITSIKYTERKNLGNYEHSEVSAEAILDDLDNVGIATQNLINFVKSTLNNDFPIAHAPAEVVSAPATYNEETNANVHVDKVYEVPKKEKKSKKSTYKFVESVSETPIVEEAPKDLISYNRDLDTHRQLLSSYLTKNFPAWKTKEGIKEFSASLVGKSFLDADGNVVESFKVLLSNFFNA